jgi:hypothetical protein
MTEIIDRIEKKLKMLRISYESSYEKSIAAEIGAYEDVLNMLKKGRKEDIKELKDAILKMEVLFREQGKFNNNVVKKLGEQTEIVEHLTFQLEKIVDTMESLAKGQRTTYAN